MTTLKQLAGWLAFALAGTLPSVALAAGGFSFDTSFTHQGRLRFEGKPANGLYDFQFKLYTNLVGGGQLGPTTNYMNIPASNGLYRIDLDFGDVFLGGPRFIETAVQSATNRTGFQTLSPRQPVTAVPYALWARRGGSQVWNLTEYPWGLSADESVGLLGGTLARVSTLKLLPFPPPSAVSKKVEAIRILVTDCYVGVGTFLLQAEIRSVTGPLREVLSVAPIDPCAVPLRQWHTLTVNSASAAIVHPGEYLCLKVTRNSIFGGYDDLTLFGEATVHDAE